MPCLPALDSCTVEHVDNDAGLPGFYRETTCSSESTWQHEAVSDYHSFTDTVSLNGTKCFQRSSVWGLQISLMRWHDGTGKQVAVGVPSTTGGGVQVVCGAGTPTTPDGAVTVSAAWLAKFDRCGSKTPGTCP